MYHTKPGHELNDRLTHNTSIHTGGLLKAKNHSYYLNLEQDGELVLYNSTHFSSKNAIWRSGSANKGQGPYRLTMQDDGNLVIYDNKNTAVWASDTWNKGAKGHSCVVQDDGNFVIYDGDKKPTWSTDTWRG